MEKEYKYILIKQDSIYHEKSAFTVYNKKDKKELAVIFWHQAWKQYVFSQSSELIIFSKSCLEDIIDFISSITI